MPPPLLEFGRKIDVKRKMKKGEKLKKREETGKIKGNWKCMSEGRKN
jgi:hypothetical protein